MKRILSIFLCGILILSLVGCEAFVRKFTRKRKAENIPEQEMVVAPQEYPAAQMSKEDQYRQYFLYWKSWQGELIDSLAGTNQKKQLRCIDEALKNIEQLLPLLNADGQKKLDVHVAKLKDLRAAIENDRYSSSGAMHRIQAETIKKNILKLFSYEKIKGSLA